MKKHYMRKENDKLELLRKDLQNGEQVKVFNEYETFYGADFDNWLREGIKDIPCDIKVTSWNHWYNYPWAYEITPKR